MRALHLLAALGVARGFIYTLPLSIPSDDAEQSVTLSEGAMYAPGSPFGADGPSFIALEVQAQPQTTNNSFSSYRLYLAFSDEAGSAAIGAYDSSGHKFCLSGALAYSPKEAPNEAPPLYCGATVTSSGVAADVGGIDKGPCWVPDDTTSNIPTPSENISPLTGKFNVAGGGTHSKHSVLRPVMG